jgi:hypothetical protein
MVAMWMPPVGIGSADEDARGEKRRVGGRDLALAGGAREDEVVAVDDGGAADDGDGRCIARARIRLPPEHGDGGLGAIDGGGSWAPYLPDAVILPSTVPGSSVPAATVIVSRV